MNNYYNSNQGGIYGNQYQGNNYQNQNYNRPPGGYPNPGYNQPYNQSNYGQNNQNSGPRPFIVGKIGRNVIASEDLNTFSQSLKNAEWTNNQSYLQAKNIAITMKVGLQNQIHSNDVDIPKNRLNDYCVNLKYNPNDYFDFIRKVEDDNKRKKNEIERERRNFMKSNFPNENIDISNNELYKKIAENKKDIISKDSSLYSKVSNLLPLLKKDNNGGYNYNDAPAPNIGSY